jgi:hypothetical protein
MYRMHAQRMHFVLFAFLGPASLSAAPRPSSDLLIAALQPATAQAWDRYVQWADQKVQDQLSTSGKFLIQDYLPAQKQSEVRRALDAGEVFVDRITGVVPPGTKFTMEDGEVHHWWGTILLPGATIEHTVQFLQDYDHHAGRFADLEKSSVLTRNGQDFKVFLRLRRSAALVTAYYNTEEECSWAAFGPRRAFSKSNATKIAELESPGTPREREKPPGQDRGFLWRLVSWWRIEQTERGVVVEIESASLSRDIPTIARFIPGVTAYINSIPKDSLRSILTSIRNSPK